MWIAGAVGFVAGALVVMALTKKALVEAARLLAEASEEVKRATSPHKPTGLGRLRPRCLGYVLVVRNGEGAQRADESDAAAEGDVARLEQAQVERELLEKWWANERKTEDDK